MANQTGKRYVCEKCGATYLVTKGGDGELVCCGQPMGIKKQAVRFTVKKTTAPGQFIMPPVPAVDKTIKATF